MCKIEVVPSDVESNSITKTSLGAFNIHAHGNYYILCYTKFNLKIEETKEVEQMCFIISEIPQVIKNNIIF